MQQFVIFEDERVDNFNPLVYFRPVYELRVGAFTLREKIEKLFGQKVDLQARKFLEKVLQEQFADRKVNEFYGEDIIFINGRVIFNSEAVRQILLADEDTLFFSGDTVVAAKLKSENYLKIIPLSQTIDFTALKGMVKEKEIDVKVFNYTWDLIYANGDELFSDSKYFLHYKEFSSVNFPNVAILGKGKILVGNNVEIQPFVTLDTSQGVIIIDDEVKVMSQSVIQGPAYIGKKSIIKIGAKIYHETTIGEVCKVGGEVENSIFYSYSNKQHDGFLGHAYLGQWVNLGANTNNSDLKNNYGKISVKLNGKTVETGLQFLGLIIGDHSKTAIGTLFNTGTIVGVSSNIFGAGFPPRAIPSFAWGGSDFIKEYKLEKALEVAEIVMSRRNKKLSESMKRLFSDVFKYTENERSRYKK